MTFDPRVYRNKDGVGMPSDPKATDATTDWTLVSLAKGLYALLAGTITVSLPTGAATAANQTSEIAALAAIDGHVDGLEGLIGSTNTKLDTLHTDVTAATPTGTNLIGRAVADASAATGGIASTARMASAAASTNATNVKTSAGRVYQASGKNNAAYDVFVVLYDSAANPPVPGTTTIRKKMVCPAGQAFVYDWPVGMTCATGIGYAFTKLVADADTTVLVAADITAFNLDYV
jgi:hypothetical protein